MMDVQTKQIEFSHNNPSVMGSYECNTHPLPRQSKPKHCFSFIKQHKDTKNTKEANHESMSLP